MSSTLTPTTAADADQRIVLDAVTWCQYETVLNAFSEQPGLRITYLDGRLTLVSPPYRHDQAAERCADVVKAVTRGLGRSLEQAGQATYRKEGESGGVEGDKTFYLAEHAERMIGEQEIDLSTQPPPDLVIEVEATHRADDSVAVWGRLGVPEVWRLDVSRGALTFGAPGRRLLRPLAPQPGPRPAGAGRRPRTTEARRAARLLALVRAA